MKTLESELKLANRFFRENKFFDALEFYNILLIKKPELARTIGFNVRLARCRLQKQAIKNFEELSKGCVPRLKKSYLSIYSVKDINGLEKISDQEWKSLHEDPYFILDQQQLFNASGPWYLLELAIKGPRKHLVSRLYIDSGSGFNETETVDICSETNKLINRVFRLPTNPQAVRFDPIDAPGLFAINVFHIHPLSSQEAQQQMLNYLIQKKELPHIQDSVGVKDFITEKAYISNQEPMELLYEMYNKALMPQASSVEYEDWINALETPSLPSQAVIQRTLASMQKKPLISVIVPIYNTPEIYLRACIESVLAQSYPHWELCIADDCSTAAHIAAVLKEYADKESRILYTRRPTNGHISLASNSALELAQGDFVALLDHDDLLAKHALYFIAEAINAHPDASVLYSDEDKIDTYGKRSEPHFKSDWNPDLFFSQNYVSHLGVYRRSILTKIDGFRVGVEGSQDQDLLLRCLPHVGNEQIIHIPRILYHWRVVEGSTALAAGEKSYTTEAGIKALQDYFNDNGPRGIQVEAGLVANTYRVCWPVPVPEPLVSLLIPTRDKKDITEVAVNSILEKTSYTNYEILILDNGSVEPETIEWFSAIQQRAARVKVLRYDYPFNYSAINNFGVKHASGSIIGLINNDIEVINAEWLTEMVSHVVRPNIGCVGAKLYYSDGKIQHAGVVLGIGGVAGHSHKYFSGGHHGYFSRLKLIQDISAVTAACLLVRRDVYDAVGGLDELNLTVAFNDVDFCLNVRELGYRNLWTPFSELYHHESISRGHEDTPEKKERFQREVEYMKNRWGEILKNDPYYNPNLTKNREDFSIGV